jgi:hypothetical protein
VRDEKEERVVRNEGNVMNCKEEGKGKDGRRRRGWEGEWESMSSCLSITLFTVSAAHPRDVQI